MRNHKEKNDPKYKLENQNIYKKVFKQFMVPQFHLEPNSNMGKHQNSKTKTKTDECVVSLGYKDCLDLKSFPIRCESFPIKTNEYVFWKNKHLHMHSSTQILHAGIIFDADSELKVRFSML